MGGDLSDLIAWTEASALAADLVNRVASFKGPGAAGAADQIARAAESISANIAEGYGRGFGVDGARLLRYARGSGAELESHLWVGVRAKRFGPEEGAEYLRRIRRVRALVHGLIKRYGGDKRKS